MEMDVLLAVPLRRDGYVLEAQRLLKIIALSADLAIQALLIASPA